MEAAEAQRQARAPPPATARNMASFWRPGCSARPGRRPVPCRASGGILGKGVRSLGPQPGPTGSRWGREMRTIDWRERGRCKGADPSVFYPEDDDDPAERRQGDLRVLHRAPRLLGARDHDAGTARRVGRRDRAGTPAHDPSAPEGRVNAPIRVGSACDAVRPPARVAELQATVRKLAQEKVAPRAREIDTTADVPAGPLRAVPRRRPARARRARGVRRGRRRDPRASRSRSKRSRSTRTPPRSCCCSPGCRPGRC